MNDIPRYKILVVDDEETNIIAFTHILMSNYDILTALDGQTGVAVAKKNNPDSYFT